MAESQSTHSSSVHSRKTVLDEDDLWTEAVNDWLNTTMRNTAMSQSTEGWNFLVNTGIPELRKILRSKN